MNSSTVQKARASFPFVLSILALGLIVFTTRQLLAAGYDGIELNPLTGEVLSIDPAGPAVGSMRVGDQVLQVNDVTIAQASPVFAVSRPGDSLRYLVDREGTRFDTTIRLRETPTSLLVQYLVTPLVAASFWAIGVAVVTFGPRGPQTRLFLAFTLVASSTLVAGSISAEGPAWISTLFNILVWFAGPVAVQLHLGFPEPVQDRRLARLPAGLYALALLGSLPFVLFGAQEVRASALISPIFVGERLFLSVSLLLVVLLLFHAYRSASNVTVLQRVRLVVLGGGLGLLLVIALSLLPGALLAAPLIPYDYSFAFLIAIPASYGYAIVRQRLIAFERFLSRGAAYTLVFALLAAIYLGLVRLIPAVLPEGFLGTPLINMLLILLLAATAVMLYRRIEAIVDFAFYGGWYDYRTAIERITSELDTLHDSETLAATLGERLQGTLLLQSACVFVAARDGSLQLSRTSGCQFPSEIGDTLMLPLDGTLMRQMGENSSILRGADLVTLTADLPLTKDERAALPMLSNCLLVPVRGSEGLQGLLALGARRGGEEFSAEDRAILKQVARHSGFAIETVRLTIEVRRQAEEVRQLNMRLMRAREDERKALARRLHDEAIQALIGLNYQLAHLAGSETQGLRDEIRLIVEQLRGIIRDLRPPALDTFGLVTAVRTEIRERDGRTPDHTRIDLRLTGDSELNIAEDVSVCVYRVIQEALNNVERHAEANSVEVQLILHPEQIQAVVQDDGRGFSVPRPLGALVESNHFGLVGLRERVQLLRGTLELHSVPGEGTTLHVRLPLLPRDDERS